jgi:hypothetical protein
MITGGRKEANGMDIEVDLKADLNAQDDDGLGWSVLADARHPEKVRPGSMLLAGGPYGQAVVQIIAVDDDGQVHFTILPGSIEKNRHLLGRVA